MARSRSRRKQKPRARKARQRNSTWWGRAVSFIGRYRGRVIAAVGALLGIIKGYQELRPELAVTATAIDPGGHPFTSSFEVRNSSAYALRNVETACILNHLRLASADFQSGVIRARSDLEADTLSRNESKTVRCAIDIGDGDPARPAAIEFGRSMGDLRTADITIAAKYSTPWWVPFAEETYARRFVGRRTAAGWRWESQPVSGGPE